MAFLSFRIIRKRSENLILWKLWNYSKCYDNHHNASFWKKAKSREAGQEFLFKGLAEDQGAFQQQFFLLTGTAHKLCRSSTNNCLNLNMCGQNDRRQLYILFIVKIPKKRTSPKIKLIRVLFHRIQEIKRHHSVVWIKHSPSEKRSTRWLLGCCFSGAAGGSWWCQVHNAEVTSGMPSVSSNSAPGRNNKPAQGQRNNF